MKVSKIGGKGMVLELEFEGVSPAFMNSLRRTVMGDVPTLAVEVCEIRKNSSALYDEMLAHRIGLIPLATDLESYSLPTDDERKSGEFQAGSSVKGTLKAKGPGLVLAKELSFKNDPKVKPVYPETPIVKLLEGQEIELEVTAVLGCGHTHAKWSPGLVYYHEVPTWKGKSLSVADERTLLAKGAMKGVDEASESFVKSTNHFYCKVESWGQLKPIVMLSAALDQFSKTLKEFDGIVKEVAE